jgi:dethiobiotin synthetase/adenosylmethionine--8-amino-7-oxononanoate aminotransferase
LPLAATLASRSIFEAFLSDRKVDALLHGHSYTAHPVGCAVALRAVQSVERLETEGGWSGEKGMWGVGEVEGEEQAGTSRGAQRWSFWSPDFVRDVSRLEGVKGAMAMGTVCAIELRDDDGGELAINVSSEARADIAGYSSHTAQNFLTRLRSRRVDGGGADADALTPFQIHSRPLGNVLYFMTSLFTRPEVVRAMERALGEELGR